MDVIALQTAIRLHQRLISQHALNEAIADQLDPFDIWDSLLNQTTEAIEDYPNDPRGASCLLLSFVGSSPIHSVIAFPSPRAAAQLGHSAVAVLITVYRPDQRPTEWSPDFKRRLP
ncbi:MAG TPA: DUF4258 domain-containing protein [Ktedonobacterales bacterium]|nr:DUF4258 domain-containing protein [Ktedonobacterales bacterium]